MASKLTYEDVRALFEDVRGFKLLEKTYVNSETPMKYVCTCGRVGYMSYKNAKKGRNCKDCGKEKLSKAKQIYTFDYIVKYFDDNDCILLATSYNADPHFRMPYICVCGSIAEISWSDFKDGHRCKQCRTKKVSDARRKYTIDDLFILFEQQGKILLETSFENSQTPLRYICKCGNKSSITLNNFLKGKDCYMCRNEKISSKMKSPFITDADRERRRSSKEFKEWRKVVYKKDNYTCQCCGVVGKNLNAHHIYNFADFLHLSLDVNNGITLCEACHRNFHKNYGSRNTNKKQLDEFIEEYRIKKSSIAN